MWNRKEEMKSKIIQIFTCEQCPFYIFDDNGVEERYGKPWCDKIDKEVPEKSISEDCPLSDDVVNVIPEREN